jgi:glycine betaine/proline transport system permease protein
MVRQTRSARFAVSRFRVAGPVVVIALVLVSGALATVFVEFPKALHFSMAGPVNSGVDWAAVHLYFITSWIRDDLIREFGLAPIQTSLRWLPWPVTVIGITALAYPIAGKKAAILTAAAFLFFGFAGVWELAMHTFSQVLVAVALSVVLGVAVGIWASQSDAVESALRPILDTMQTMPVFVYLIPVIMLWSSGPIAGIIATVIYALPPAIRMTSLGIRLVPQAMVDTAVSHGSTRFQTLLQVQIPLAMPTVMMGVNQTIIMALAMVIIGGLVGGGGLGEEVFVSAVYMDMGQGFVAGISIVLMAMVLDRVSHGRGSRPQAFALER